MTSTWVVVLSFNDAQSTLRCIRSIRTHLTLPGLRVVVVDNGSTTSRMPSIEPGFPPVTVLYTGANLGFAGGVNFALRRIRTDEPDYVLLLNNDTLVYEDFISPLLDFMDGNPKVAVAGPIITDQDSGSIQSAGIWLSGFLLLARNPYFRADPAELLGHGWPIRADYVAGSAMLVRVSTFREIGLLDERFFLYEEEVDFCLRARETGHEIAVVPINGVRHKGSGTIGRMPLLKQFHIGRSHVLLLRKHQSPATAALSVYAYTASEIAVRVGQALLGKGSLRELVAFARGVAGGVLASSSSSPTAWPRA